jgi:Lrp/AsnC family transcriptional regulator for asnA, asnC and gidA
MQKEGQIHLDDIDRKILSILLKDGKRRYAEIGQELFISAGTVHVRIKKLMEIGVIIGNHIEIDHKLLGYDITSFLGIYLEKSSLYDEVSKQLKAIPEVVSAHYTTGVYGIFVKIICKDTEHLRDTLSNKIQKINGIQRTETFISLDESIERPLYIYTEDK